MKKFLFLIGLFFVFFAGCESTTENENPVPGRVRLVEKSSEEDTLETGIDAEGTEAGKNAVFIHWYPVSDDDLIAYDIYRKEEDSTGTFPLLNSVSKQFGIIDTFFLDQTVEENTRYFYYVRARDEKEQEGEPSEKATYKVVTQPQLNFPGSNQIVSNKFDFEWDFVTDLPYHRFVFRLKKLHPEDYKDFFTKPLELGTDYSRYQKWTFEALGISSPLPTGTYRWRIDVLAGDFEGAESRWVDFIVP